MFRPKTTSSARLARRSLLTQIMIIQSRPVFGRRKGVESSSSSSSLRTHPSTHKRMHIRLPLLLLYPRTGWKSIIFSLTPPECDRLSWCLPFRRRPSPGRRWHAATERTAPRWCCATGHLRTPGPGRWIRSQSPSCGWPPCGVLRWRCLSAFYVCRKLLVLLWLVQSRRAPATRASRTRLSVPRVGSRARAFARDTKQTISYHSMLGNAWL